MSAGAAAAAKRRTVCCVSIAARQQRAAAPTMLKVMAAITGMLLENIQRCRQKDMESANRNRAMRN